MPDAEVQVRPATSADRDDILTLARRALGWAGDERDRAFFAWKHDENPFGPSPGWVAVAEGRVVGFRTFLRWELARDGARLHCVRAVDTATDPDAQGRGVFRTLTLSAIDELTVEGVDAIFNTPNEQSRPGYLKMGWSELGRPDLAVVPRTPASLPRMARSQEGAVKWSEATGVGEEASEVLASDEVARLIAALPPAPGWATPRTVDHLQWRYGFGPLRYRAVEVRGGWCVFRMRRRGPSTEVAVCEWLSPDRDRGALHRVLRATGADYAVGIGLRPLRHGALPLPHRGPRLVWRPLAREGVPRLEDLALGLGDLELF